jgi:hypothetical protein
VIITLAMSIGTVLVTVPTAFLALFVAGPLLDAFDTGSRDPRWLIAGATVGVVALSVMAGLLALLVLRRSRWARWLLVGVSTVAALVGGLLGYYIAPLLLTAAGLAVTALLLMPAAQAWFRAPHGGSGSGSGQATS